MKGMGRIAVAILIMTVAALIIHVLGGVVIHVMFGEGEEPMIRGSVPLIVLLFFAVNLYTAVVFYGLFKILGRRIPVGDFLRPLVFGGFVWLIASIPQGAGEWIKAQADLPVVLCERVEDLIAFGVMGLALYYITIRKPRTKEVTVTPDSIDERS
jgi:hypothetical protein